MKQGIHPEYRPVVFRDRSADLAFLTRSTATSTRTIEWTDGRTYPVIDVEIVIALTGRLGSGKTTLNPLLRAPGRQTAHPEPVSPGGASPRLRALRRRGCASGFRHR